MLRAPAPSKLKAPTSTKDAKDAKDEPLEFTVHTTKTSAAAKRKAAPSPTLGEKPLKAAKVAPAAKPKAAAPTLAPAKSGAAPSGAGNLAAEEKESRLGLNQLVEFKQSLESKFQLKEMENGEMAGKLKSLQDQLEEARASHEKQISTMRQKNQEEIDDYSRRESRLKQEISTLTEDYDRIRVENGSLKTSLSTQSTALLTVESDIRAAKAQIESLESTVSQKTTEITVLTENLAARDSHILELESKLREEESVRRKLHNTIQELKGNIRVFCRIRPPLDFEANLDVLSHIRFSEVDDKSLELIQTSETASGQNSYCKVHPCQLKNNASITKVFQPSTNQAQVFEEISQLVQSALDGYNVCIFAYGQTGSGKTYTMEGGPSPESMGMIPRASYFLEIYNESVRDLLSASSCAGKEKHEIKHVVGDGKVTDVTIVPVTNGREVHSLLKKAQTNRAVAATNSNEHSSRSHSVFTCEGVLNLIDLAGSERLSSSGSTGDRLKETQAINKSLSSLGDVIYALGNKDQHIPYRNSKLTYLLQNSLGGNSKTLMFVNVSPIANSLQESLCSLRFATKVNSCQIGTAKAVKKAA
ncbi:kinesin-domain-containing protein [Obelidium mucronatum]|nr:kinesin-domain-containing protein [Obelidium mucronatum]